MSGISRPGREGRALQPAQMASHSGTKFNPRKPELSLKAKEEEYQFANMRATHLSLTLTPSVFFISVA